MTSRIVYLTGANRIDGDEVSGIERACLEVIAGLSERCEPVGSAHVIDRMRKRVALSSLFPALRRLEQKRLIACDGAGTLFLTDEGRMSGVRILRRRRLLERFLFDTLKVPWHEVYREAKHLEPLLSPVMEARIEALTADATTCPYGNPVPGRSQVSPGECLLVTAPINSWFIVTCIDEDAGEDSCALQFLWTRGLRPGVPLVRRPDACDGLVVQRADRRIVLSRRMAQFLWGATNVPKDESDDHRQAFQPA
ncbi:MAG: metal-dependent transcriptional regulator [Roseiflexus sp.]